MVGQWLIAQADPGAGDQAPVIALAAIGVTVVGLVIVSILKGRWWAVLLLLAPILAFALPFTALRLAKPNTWWARRFYGDEKMAAAIKRHGIVPADRVDRPPAAPPSSDLPEPAIPGAPPPSGPPSAPPAGWYPDPHGVARLRYWDGTEWTDQTGA